MPRLAPLSESPGAVRMRVCRERARDGVRVVDGLGLTPEVMAALAEDGLAAPGCGKDELVDAVADVLGSYARGRQASRSAHAKRRGPRAVA